MEEYYILTTYINDADVGTSETFCDLSALVDAIEDFTKMYPGGEYSVDRFEN